MDQEQHRNSTADAAQSRAGTTGGSEPADVVDEAEERIITERRAAGVAGNADERAQVTAVDGDDQAPD